MELGYSYSKERAREWINRSDSPEYQKAYEVIARHAPVQDAVAVEFGIGPGNLISRLVDKGARLVVGVDSSSVMLETAEARLREKTKVKVITPDKFSPNDDGVVLVRGNFYEGVLPNAFADVTIFDFPPEVRFPIMPIDSELKRRFQLLFPNGHFEGLLPKLRPDYHMARITKIGGTTLLVPYDSMYADKKYDEGLSFERKLAAMNGLQLEKISFFESPKVFSDVQISPQAKRLKDGYCIIGRKRVELAETFKRF